MHDNAACFRRVPTPATFGEMVNPAQPSESERQDGNAHRAQMPQGIPPEPKKSPNGAIGSQQLTTSSRSIQGETLHGTGAQFQDQQHFPGSAGLTANTIRNIDRHHGQQVSLHGVGTFPGVLGTPGYSNLRPMERFLLETRAQQPAMFIEPSRSHAPARRGRPHRFSPSSK